ncbi:lysophospholipase [Hoyosella sp. YIM 151337]|uniref:alpha/beta hydrolase n=1 Tax=Hoyosella sp. YIM 151337 TaxID=2992742 RepID=UPI0022363A97|nr:alpha/beta hydrolase [Hoyosella sp. YIM 151337]MCW4355858.1 lysophospholipase [Hoyosella sp. YIM 151337]
MEHSESFFRGVYGTRINYSVWKPDGEPSGIMVISHGLGEHAERYAHVAEAFTGLGLVVYAPDHRGHGRSGGRRLGLRTWGDFTADLHTMFAIARRHNPGLPTVLLGHSMGGTIALTYALEHPEGLSAVVLSAPAIQLATGTPKLIVALGKTLGRYLPFVPVEKISADDVSRDPVVVEQYKNDPLVHHGFVPAGIARQLVLTMESLPPRLGRLRVPLLVLHGTEDKLTAVAGSRSVPDLVSNTDCTLHVYSGLYHELFNEPEKKQVLDDTVEWLQPILAAARTSS